MAKRTELKHLLQELEIATRTHERIRAISFQADEQACLFHAVGVAEKRVFSFFDKLSTELEDSAHAYKSIQEQRNYLAKELDKARKAAVEWQNAAQKAKADLRELAQQVMAMTPTAPTAPNEPFNDARARAGDPIEVINVKGDWSEHKYIGEFVNSAGVHIVTFLYNDAPEQSLASRVRMKPKAPQQLQMFANVYRGADGHTYGFLYSDSVAVGAPSPGVVQLVENSPVTITVAK